MNCLSQLSLFTANLSRRSSYFVAKSPLYEYSTALWKRKSVFVGVKTIELDCLLTRFSAQCYSSRTQKGNSGTSRLSKMSTKTSKGEEKDAYFVVRKGDIVGVYKSFSDCQAQVGSSICDPPVSVYKGYNLPKEAEEYLISRGLKDAMYTASASDIKDDLFGTLTPCRFLEPASSKGKTTKKDASKKRSQEVLESEAVAGIGLTSSKHVRLEHTSEHFCVLEFDGASKGNPGKAGAGAVLRANNGSLICRLREGIGTATNNVAEYRAMILGLKYALDQGYTSIRVQGDSKLVCMQLQGKWKVKHQNMCELYEIAKKLKDRFVSFEINHVLRELNSEADTQANLAINLGDGQVQEDFVS